MLILAVDDFKNSWQKNERELHAALKDIEGVVTREEAEKLREEIHKMSDEYAQVVMIIQSLHCEMKKKDEVLDAVRQKISLLSAEIRSINEVSLFLNSNVIS